MDYTIINRSYPFIRGECGFQVRRVRNPDDSVSVGVYAVATDGPVPPVRTWPTFRDYADESLQDFARQCGQRNLREDTSVGQHWQVQSHR